MVLAVLPSSSSAFCSMPACVYASLCVIYLRVYMPYTNITVYAYVIHPRALKVCNVGASNRVVVAINDERRSIRSASIRARMPYNRHTMLRLIVALVVWLVPLFASVERRIKTLCARL